MTSRRHVYAHDWSETFRHASLPVAVSDPTANRFVFVSAAYARLHGWPPAEMVGMPVELVYAPEEREALLDHLRRADDERVYIFESVHVRRDGSRFDVRVDIRTVLDDDGRPIYRIVTCEDLLERQQALVAQARLAAIIASSEDAIVSKSLDGGIVVSWNDAAERLFGYTAKEAIGRPIAALIIPPDRQHEEERILSQLRRGERIEHFETVRMRKDGTRIHVSLSVSPVRDQEGRIIGAAKIVRDITEQRLAAERAARLHALATALTTAATATDVARVIVREGSAALGAALSNVALVDERAGVVHQAAWSGYDEAVIASWEGMSLAAHNPMLDAIRTGEIVAYDSAAARADSYGVHPVPGMQAGLVVPLVVGGRAVGGWGVNFVEARRFTAEELAFARTVARLGAQSLERARLLDAERRAREQATRLQQVTTALAEAATTREIADVILTQGLAALGGSAGFIMRLGDDGLLHQVRLVGYSDAMRRRFDRFPLSAPYPAAEAVRTGHAVWLETRAERQARFPALADSPTTHDYASWMFLPLIARGQVLGAMSFAFVAPRRFLPEERDFAESLARACALALERARLYEGERAARAEAEQANAAKMQFLATMSHELRTPLNAIGGYAELLAMGLRGPVTEAQRDDLERIQRSQRHLLSLINDVLNFTKLEAGRVELRIGPIVLRTLLGELEVIVQPMVAAKALALACECAEPLVACGDPEKVRQILLNLTSNAIKFTQPGGAVRVTCERDPERDGVVLVHVCDTGRGIARGQLEAIFDPFVQVGRELNQPAEGVGLGLAISRDLARAMGGDIRVESEVGAGSTFTLSLPKG